MFGKVFFKYGCMGSGKSLQLLATANNFQEHSIPFVILKSSIDTRDGESVISSRALNECRECVSINSNDNIYSIISEFCIENYSKLKWILVDEAQFLSEEQVDQLAKIADDLGISIICYGLRTDFKTHLFSGSKRLFEIANNIEEIKSSCYCGDKTIFNARINQSGEIIVDGEQIEIGGDDKYVSLCRKCYYEKLEKQKNNNN